VESQGLGAIARSGLKAIAPPGQVVARVVK
jgi:hypothetical protein